MKAILLLALLAVAFAARTDREYQREFTKWMQTHQKAYHHDEFQNKFNVFKANLDFIDAHNADNTKTHKVAVNKFADLTGEEFARFYLGTKITVDTVPTPVPTAPDAPASMDWRQKNAVTGIKNQQQCGSCWSFSTTGSTEGCHAIKTGNLVGLSEQNLVDCSTAQGNQGCNGGLMTAAMTYIISNKGIDTEASYPYTATGPNTCEFSSSNIGATLSSYVNVAQGNEGDLLVKGESGPVSVAIDASQSSFQFYSSGVYYEPACSSTSLDHGVLMVGWGTDSSSGNAYWIVKNSWGTDWGLQGYIWMSRNRSNNCGIATMATLPQC
jgi:cathepsin L